MSEHLEQPSEQNPHQCPIYCPNRSHPGDGLCLFGVRIDPLEVALHLCIVVVLGFPAIRAAAKPDFEPGDGLQWFGAIALGSALVRLSPTDRINAYTNLFK